MEKWVEALVENSEILIRLRPAICFGFQKYINCKNTNYKECFWDEIPLLIEKHLH